MTTVFGRRRAAVGLVSALALALAATACGSGNKDDGSPSFQPDTPSPSVTATKGNVTIPPPAGGKASPQRPLAARVFTLPVTADVHQQAVLRSWETYMDGIVTAMARNSFSGTAVKARTTSSGLAASLAFISDQIKKSEVFYGPFVFHVSAPELRSARGSIPVCVDQSGARFYQKATGKPTGRKSEHPFVNITFFVSHSLKGWLVSGFSAAATTACPA
jgi:hypothetical protein